MIKKIILIFLALVFVLAIATGVIVYRYRYEIFRVSADAIIRKNLPSYITMEKIVFDLDRKEVRVTGLGIKNPEGYQNTYLAYVDEVSCSYSMKGRNVLDGIIVSAVQTNGVLVNIERQRNGRMNVSEMGKVMSSTKAPRPDLASGMAGLSISKLVKLPEDLTLNNGKVVFIDNFVSRQPLIFTFENVNSAMKLILKEDYSSVLSMSSSGSGLVDGDRIQAVSWNMSVDPTKQLLTMSCRVEAESVDIMRFLPYYDRFCPVEVKKGLCSGTFVYDLDNGRIGSDNIIYLNGFEFNKRSSMIASGFWEASLSDVVTYLETAPGQVTFDFKIKGTVDDPRFLPGPIVVAAMQRMAVDTIATILRKPAEEGQQDPEPRTNTEKVIGLVKGIMQEFGRSNE